MYNMCKAWEDATLDSNLFSGKYSMLYTDSTAQLKQYTQQSAARNKQLYHDVGNILLPGHNIAEIVKLIVCRV